MSDTQPEHPPASPASPPPGEASGRDQDLLRRGPRQASSRLVLLHGWGADADDLLELGALLADPAVSVVALQAPGIHPSGEGRQWYDLQQPGWPQLPHARRQLGDRLRQLDQEIPLKRTVLLGFSQGAAMALDVATGREPLAVAGVIACSGYPHPGWSPCPEVAAGCPVLLTHGRQDPVVPYAASEALSRDLEASGFAVELLGFAGGHGIEAELLPRLQQQLRQVLAG